MIKTKPRYLYTGKQNYTVIRTSAGSWSSGRYVAPTPASVIISANIQEVFKGTSTNNSIDGDTSSKRYVIYTNDEIRQLVEGDNGWAADLITYGNYTLEVTDVICYAQGTLAHYEAYAMRKELT